MKKKLMFATEPDLDELTSLAKARLSAEAKRAQQINAYDKKLISKLLKLLGVTREELEKQADADFARAKSESARRLKQLRALLKSRMKRRKPLRERIEIAFGQRLEPKEVTK
jgi:predicted component of type VI protein secretion system